jgi:DNA primase
MASFQSTKEEIKRRADIVDVIGQFVRLKKTGRNYVGLCPFHAEKSPSFTVNLERQIFHCFGCKKGGDVFEFWMQYHGVSFQEALQELARRYGLELPERRFDPQDKRKSELRTRLLEVNELACAYFASNIRAEGGKASSYLRDRGLSDEIIEEYTIGYALNQWDGLVSYITAKGGDIEAAEMAGLIIPRSGGYYDRFRARVMFPIFNLTGRVVGFGGRCLDDSLPKYLNSPESLVFHKGELLYGLKQSLEHIRRSGKIIVVEGYMDYLALCCCGILEAAAVLGTALTSDHVRKIKGIASEAFVVFDSDTAGRAAAMKSLPLFLNEGMPARAVALPEGDDPDSFVRREGREGFLRRMEVAPSLFDFILTMKTEKAGVLPEEKIAVMRDLTPALAAVSDDPLCSLYVRRLSQRLDIPEEIVRREVERERRGAVNQGSEGPTWSMQERELGSDGQILNLMVYHPDVLFLELKGCRWELVTSAQTTREILKVFFDLYERQGRALAHEIVDLLENEEARNRLRDALLRPCMIGEEGVGQAVADFLERERQAALKEMIRQAKELGDIEQLNTLLKIKGQSINRKIQ